MKIYIAVVGKTCAGKETVYKIVQAMFHPRFRVSIHHFSDPLNENLDLLCLPRTRPNQQKLSTVLRGAFGEELLGNIIYQRALRDTSEIVFLDGVRRPKDVVMLKKLSQTHAFLIYIFAPIDKRFERLKKRNDRPGDAEKTWEQFLAEQSAEAESLIEILMPIADFKFDNSNDDKEFKSLNAQIMKFFREKILTEKTLQDKNVGNRALNIGRDGTDVT